MSKQKTIVLFDEVFRAIAFVNGDFQYETSGIPATEELNSLDNLLQSLRSKPPRIRTEHSYEQIITMDLAPVEPQNKEHILEAIAEELNMAGFMAKVIPVTLKPILQYISIRLTVEERSKIIGDLLNIPEGTSIEALDEFQDILTDLKQLKEKP